MGFTLTPDESGNYSIEGSYDSPRGKTVTYSGVNEVTGEAEDNFYFGDESVESDDVEFGDPDVLERNQQYLDALVEVNPALPSAVQWAAKNWDPELVQAFNNSLDAEDWETLNKLTESLVNAYQEDGGSVEPTEADDSLEGLAQELELTDELAKVSQDSLGDLAVLREHVFTSEAAPELADAQMHQAETLYGSGDYAGAMIASLSAQYHAGNMDAKTAVKAAIGKLGMRDAISAYTRLAFDYSATGDNLQYGYDSYNSYYDGDDD